MSSGIVLDLLWSDAVEKEEDCCLWMFLAVMEGRERDKIWVINNK